MKNSILVFLLFVFITWMILFMLLFVTYYESRVGGEIKEEPRIQYTIIELVGEGVPPLLVD